MDSPTRARAISFYGTTLGKKVVMAVTGFILFGFLVVHVLGNMEIFAGSRRIDAYSYLLHHELAGPLWFARAVLFVSVIAHIVAATQLYTLKAKARPVAYRVKKNRGATFYSRFMLYSGIALALFIVYHILHITTGTLHMDYVEGDVFHNLVSAFHVWWVAAIYVVAMIFLAFHLNHGLWSMTQSVGVSSPRYSFRLKQIAVFVAIILAAGFALIPVAILAGLIG